MNWWIGELVNWFLQIGVHWTRRQCADIIVLIVIQVMAVFALALICRFISIMLASHSGSGFSQPVLNTDEADLADSRRLILSLLYWGPVLNPNARSLSCISAHRYICTSVYPYICTSAICISQNTKIRNPCICTIHKIRICTSAICIILITPYPWSRACGTLQGICNL